MKTKITLFTILLFLFTHIGFAQFSSNDIQFWIGEGDSEAYLVVDFRDGTTDPSFAWGVKFNAEDELTFADLFDVVAAAEPNFTFDNPGGFLNDVVYNSHGGFAGDPDYWSTWSGDTSVSMTMNSGISEDLENSRWYGISYGFSPPEMPTITYPAYSSQWFSVDELEYSIGEGEDYAVIVIDFVEANNDDPVSFAWKVQFDGNISSLDALQLINENDLEFELTLEDGQIANLTYMALEGGEWLSYSGTNLSDWVLAEPDTNLQDGDWFGLAKGASYSRRPFIPVPAEENPVMGTGEFSKNTISLYPNPANDIVNIKSVENVESVILYNMFGQRVQEYFINASTSTIDVSALDMGTYFLKISTNGQFTTYKVLKN